MNILVCISSVPDTTFSVQTKDDDSVVDTSGVRYIINPDDEYGLYKSIQLQSDNNADVTVVCVGDESCEPVLRRALAIGADRAVRVNTSPQSGLQVARQLEKIVRDGQYDLIITGRESIDYNGAIVPGALSALLGISLVNDCVGLDVGEEGKKVLTKREVDTGTETLAMSTPFIISAKKGIVEDKYLKVPNMRAIMMARQKPLEVIVSESSDHNLKHKKIFKVKKESKVRMIDENNLDDLVEVISRQAFTN